MIKTITCLILFSSLGGCGTWVGSSSKDEGSSDEDNKNDTEIVLGSDEFGFLVGLPPKEVDEALSKVIAEGAFALDKKNMSDVTNVCNGTIKTIKPVEKGNPSAVKMSYDALTIDNKKVSDVSYSVSFSNVVFSETDKFNIGDLGNYKLVTSYKVDGKDVASCTPFLSY